MTKFLAGMAFAIVMFLSGAGGVAYAGGADFQSSGTNALHSKWEIIAARAAGDVGAVAMNLQTGEKVSVDSDRWYPMQSVYKLPIAMAVLSFVDNGKLNLNQQVEIKPADFVSPPQHSPLRDRNPTGVTLPLSEVIRMMICESDSSACDVCLRLLGEPKVVLNFLREQGLAQVNVMNSEKEIGMDEEAQFRNSCTPNGMVDLLKKLDNGDGLSTSSHQLLIKYLTEATTGRNRLKGKLGRLTVAHKTGSSGTVDGITAATNDVGIITLKDGTRIAIAVFVSKSPKDQAIRDGVIADMALAAVEHWNGK